MQLFLSACSSSPNERFLTIHGCFFSVATGGCWDFFSSGKFLVVLPSYSDYHSYLSEGITIMHFFLYVGVEKFLRSSTHLQGWWLIWECCVTLLAHHRPTGYWVRQLGWGSVIGPDTFRLSRLLVGSSVRAIVSPCLARIYIYGREICRLSVGPPSLKKSWRKPVVSRKYDCRNPQVRPEFTPLLQLDSGPATVKSRRSSSCFGQLPGWSCQ